LSDVTAIVVGARAVTLPGAQVAAVVHAASSADLRQAAEAADSDLLWILDSGATPSAETLPALLRAAWSPAASLPIDATGAPVEAAIGRYAEDDVPALLDAAAEHRVPLRRTQLHSLLIERDLTLDLAPPDPGRFGGYAGTEWTSRLFARRRGVLVPASQVRIVTPTGANPLHALRAARAGGWGAGETLRELQWAMGR
jgi:hypothetical protein